MLATLLLLKAYIGWIKLIKINEKAKIVLNKTGELSIQFGKP